MLMNIRKKIIYEEEKKSAHNGSKVIMSVKLLNKADFYTFYFCKEVWWHQQIN